MSESFEKISDVYVRGYNDGLKYQQAIIDKQAEEIARRDIIIKLHASIIERQAAELDALRGLLIQLDLQN